MTPGIQIANGVPPADRLGIRHVIGRDRCVESLHPSRDRAFGVCTFLSSWTGLAFTPSHQLFGAYTFGFSGYVDPEGVRRRTEASRRRGSFPLLLLALSDASPPDDRLRGNRRACSRTRLLHSLLLRADRRFHGRPVRCGRNRPCAFGRTERLWRFTLFDVATAVAFLSLVPALAGPFLLPSTVRESERAPDRVAAAVRLAVRRLLRAEHSQSRRSGSLVPSGSARRMLESFGEPSLYFGLTAVALACTWLLIRRRGLSPSPPEDHFLTVFGAQLLWVGG